MKKGLIVVCIIYGLFVFATTSRKVSIPAANYSSSSSSTDGVTLVNGSPVTVNYNITCYNKAGNLNFSQSNLSLASKASVKHAHSQIECQNGAFTYSVYTSGMVRCGSTNTPDSTVCPINYRLCTFAEVQAKSTFNGYKGTNGDNGWVSSGFSFSVSGGWSTGYTSNSSLVTTNYDTTINEYPTVVTNPHLSCYSSINGGGTTLPNCGEFYSVAGTGTQPNFCCPSTAAIDIPSYSCDVEIAPTTPSNGYLQSPQFKGNAPF